MRLRSDRRAIDKVAAAVSAAVEGVRPAARKVPGGRFWFGFPFAMLAPPGKMPGSTAGREARRYFVNRRGPVGVIAGRG